MREYALTVARLQSENQTRVDEYEAKLKRLTNDFEAVQTSEQMSQVTNTKDALAQRNYVAASSKDSSGK